jgi:uncharacterized membrane protein
VIWLWACTVEDSAPAADSVPTSTEPSCTQTWDNTGDGFFATYCRGCHSAETPNRYDAPEGVDFDTEAQVIAQQALIRAVVDGGTMPVGGGILDDDLTLFGLYMDCLPEPAP